MSAPAVWVTRPEPGNRRTAKALAGAGYTVIAAPVLAVNVRFPAAFQPREWPEWLVLVSANAVRGLAAMEKAGRLPGAEGRSRVRVAAVGRHTAEAARAEGWSVEMVPDVQDAGSLADALARHALNGATAWIPGGNREGSATRDLPGYLRSQGAVVRVFQVYETVARQLPPDDLDRLAGAEPGALVLHSPSSAEAVYAPSSEETTREPAEPTGSPAHAAIRGPAPERLRRWRTAPAVCIGPATAARCRELAGIQILECKSPSDRDIVDALSSIPFLSPHGKDDS